MHYNFDRQALENTCNAILNTPKPKVEPPKEEKKDDKETDKKEENVNGGDTAANKNKTPVENMEAESEEPAKDHNMDVD